MIKNDIVILYEDIKTHIILTENQKRGLIELKKVIGEQNVIIQLDDTVLIKKYVGFYVNKNIRLQILPKIYQDEISIDNEIKIEKSVFLFFKLLMETGYDKLLGIKFPEFLGQNKIDIFELFIELFIAKLKAQIERSFHKNYENFEENLNLIKGKILHGKSILKNSFLNHKHVCEFTEFTENNLLNKIFKSTLFNLLQVTKSKANQREIKQLLSIFENVNKILLSKEIFKKVLFTRLNDDYKPIFNLAKLFYNNHIPGFKEGDEFTFSFLIPLNSLFEYFSYRLISKIYYNQNFKVLYQKPQKKLLKRNEEKFIQQRPDITVKKENKLIRIFDAKYQNLFINGNFNPSPSIIYQLLSYSINYKCDFICIIFPKYLNGKVITDQESSFTINNYDRIIKLQFIQIDITEKLSKLAKILSDRFNLISLDVE